LIFQAFAALYIFQLFASPLNSLPLHWTYFASREVSLSFVVGYEVFAVEINTTVSNCSSVNEFKYNSQQALMHE